MSRLRKQKAVAVLCALLIAVTPLAHESPVDHVDRVLKMWLADGTLYLSYSMDVPERMAMLQLEQMDADHDGVIAEKERDEFFNAFAAQLAGKLRVELKGQQLELKPHGKVVLEPACSQTYTFAAPAGKLAAGRHGGRLLDEFSRAYPGNFRWVNIKDAGAGKAKVLASDEPATQNVDGHPGVIIVKFEILVP